MYQKMWFVETTGSEQTSSAITYVVGGRVGMNDTCYFTFDLKKLDPKPTKPWTNKTLNQQNPKPTKP